MSDRPQLREILRRVKEGENPLCVWRGHKPATATERITTGPKKGQSQTELRYDDAPFELVSIIAPAVVEGGVERQLDDDEELDDAEPTASTRTFRACRRCEVELDV